MDILGQGNNAQKNFEHGVTGNIFDLKRFATGDGPGIRTLIFLKGCPLRCKWCANPESQESFAQVMYYQNKCSGCGKCIKNCPNKAIKPNKLFGLTTDFKKCTGCGVCIDNCFFNAREMLGKTVTVDEVMEHVLRDQEFYQNSGGGVTLTGGEPMFQPRFCRTLLENCKKAKIHTAMETCACVKWEIIESMLGYVDLIYFDFKHINNDLHKSATGKGNRLIIDNLKKLTSVFSNIIVRIPYIPGFNDTVVTQKEMYLFLGGLRNIKHIEVLPYHRLGISKYHGLGRKYDLSQLSPVNKQDLSCLVGLGEEFNVEVHVDPD